MELEIKESFLVKVSGDTMTEFIIEAVRDTSDKPEEFRKLVIYYRGTDITELVLLSSLREKFKESFMELGEMFKMMEMNYEC